MKNITPCYRIPLVIFSHDSAGRLKAEYIQQKHFMSWAYLAGFNVIQEMWVFVTAFCYSVLTAAAIKDCKTWSQKWALAQNFIAVTKRFHIILFYFILFYFRFVVISFSFHFRSSLESVAKHSWIIVCMTKLCYLVHDVYIFSYGNLCFRLPTLQGILPKYRHSCFLRQQMNLNMRGTKLVSLLKVSKKENPSPSS